MDKSRFNTNKDREGVLAKNKEFDPLRIAKYGLFSYPVLFVVMYQVAPTEGDIGMIFAELFLFMFFLYPIVYFAFAVLYFIFKKTKAKQFFAYIPLIFFGIMCIFVVLTIFFSVINFLL